MNSIIFHFGVMASVLVACLSCAVTNSSSPKEVSSSRSIDDLICHSQNPAVDVIHGIFSITPSTGTADVKIVALTGSLTLTNTNIDKPHVSPDGTHLVFVECTSDANGDCICDDHEYLSKQVSILDLSSLDKKIVSSAQGGLNEYPNWSPNSEEILYVHSAAQNPFDTSLLRYNIRSGETASLSAVQCPAPDISADLNALPYCMDSDNFWNADGTITVVRNKVAWIQRPDGEIRPKIVLPNNIFRFNPSESSKNTQITAFEGFHLPTDGQETHCCAADPKFSPDMSHLAYSKFVEFPSGKRIPQVTLRDGEGNEFDASESSGFEDLYPMWDRASMRLLWTRWNETAKRFSIVVRSVDRSDATQFDMIGDGIQKPKINGEEVRFRMVRWPDWDRSKGDTLIFSGSLVVPRNTDGTIYQPFVDALLPPAR